MGSQAKPKTANFCVVWLNLTHYHLLPNILNSTIVDAHETPFYISAIGPEFGGAIGLMFTLANSIAVAMYVIGFCESLLDMLTEVHGGEFGGIVDAGLNDVRIIGCGTVFVLLIIAIVGMEWITRVQTVLLVLLICSQALISSFFFKKNIQIRDVLFEFPHI